MKGKALVAGIAGFAGVAFASSAFAQEPFDSKLQAATFNTKLVRAMDECLVGTTTVGGVDACAPTNIVTDGDPTTGFHIGKILVKSKTSPTQVFALLKSSGNGDAVPGKKSLAGRMLRVQLVLRITKRTTSTAPTVPLTWVDQTLNCASVTVPSNGNFLFKGQLAGVLGCNLDLDLASDQYQKEIVSASIEDSVTGEALAVPGVRKKPPGA